MNECCIFDENMFVTVGKLIYNSMTQVTIDYINWIHGTRLFKSRSGHIRIGLSVVQIPESTSKGSLYY